jgi:biopolymer transport protein ExbD
LQLQPPAADDLPGTDKPTVAVAVDSGGRFYFGNQIVTEEQLKIGLSNVAKNSRSPLTLVIHADKSVTYEQLLSLMLLAHANGIHNAMLATLPRVTDAPATP